jgi:23S rRNA pseudoU1915 N3-methylase RlmH
MPLAAPLILPFAELAGITIAGLGMAAASKKVSDFISDNPETSTQILTMLVPGGQGLNALFKKKASVTLEDVEDMTDEEAQDLSDEDIAGVMNEAG